MLRSKPGSSRSRERPNAALRCHGRGLAWGEQVVEPGQTCLEGLAGTQQQPAVMDEHAITEVAGAVPAGVQLLFGWVQAQLQVVGEKHGDGLFPLVESSGGWPEQLEVFHVAHIALDPHAVLDELVLWVEVVVGEHVAGQAADGDAMGFAAIV